MKATLKSKQCDPGRHDFVTRTRQKCPEPHTGILQTVAESDFSCPLAVARWRESRGAGAFHLQGVSN